MTNKVKNRKKATIKDIASKNPSNKYIPVVEKGWWSSQETICVFLKYPIEEAYNLSSFARITATKEGLHLKKLICAAEADSSVEGIILDKICLLYRASCRAWVDWALTKPTVQLDPELLEAVGIKNEKSTKSNDSRRPEDEKNKMDQFRILTKTILYICPCACLEHIITVAEDSGIVEDLPSERTLRKWLKPDIQLCSKKITDKEKLAIKEKLSPLLQPSFD